MLKSINPAANHMPRSGIRVVLDEAQKIADVLHLEIGQPDLPTPAHIVTAAAEAMRAGYTGYTPNAGFFSLREAFAQRLLEDHGLAVSPDQVVVTVGAMGALFSALAAIVEPGDEVLLPDPGYPNYLMAIRMLQGIPVYYALDRTAGFSLQIDALKERIGKRSKAILINSPANPTGAMLERAQIQAVASLAQEHGLFVVSDEAYDHICFEMPHQPLLALGVEEGVVAVYSCSKTYSMTGWRVGFSVSSVKMAALLTKLQEVFVACAPSISQKAAEAALSSPQDCVAEMLATYRRRRESALTQARELGLTVLPPQGAFYLMLPIPPRWILDSTGYALELLHQQHVAVAPGRTFGPGGEGYVRIALCTGESIIEDGLRRIHAFNCQ